jgi:hypothetical protein
MSPFHLGVMHMKKMWILILCLFLFGCKQLELGIQDQIPRSKSEPLVASSLESFLENSTITVNYFDVILSEDTRELLMFNQMLGNYSSHEVYLKSELDEKYPNLSFSASDLGKLSTIFEPNRRHFVFVVTSNIYPTDYLITYRYDAEMLMIDLEVVNQSAYFMTRTVMIIISIESSYQFGISLNEVKK